MMDVLLDVSPVEVRGPMRAVKARVIYAVDESGAGRLYVARGSEDVTVFEVSEPTKTDPRRSQFAAENGLTFYRRGCGSCGYSLRSVPVDKLIAVAAPLKA